MAPDQGFYKAYDEARALNEDDGLDKAIDKAEKFLEDDVTAMRILLPPIY